MANPNKTVAAARKRMGGFPARTAPPVSDFMAWVFDRAALGVVFESEEQARAAYNAVHPEKEEKSC